MRLNDDELVKRLMHDEPIIGFDYTEKPRNTLSYLKFFFEPGKMDYCTNSAWQYVWHHDVVAQFHEMDAVINSYY